MSVDTKPRSYMGVNIHRDAWGWWALHPTAGMLRADTLSGIRELIKDYS